MLFYPISVKMVVEPTSHQLVPDQSPISHWRVVNWSMIRSWTLLRSVMASRLYKLQSKHTSNSGFDQNFMPCSGYNLFAAEQGVGPQILWVDLQRKVSCP